MTSKSVGFMPWLSSIMTEKSPFLESGMYELKRPEGPPKSSAEAERFCPHTEGLPSRFRDENLATDGPGAHAPCAGGTFAAVRGALAGLVVCRHGALQDEQRDPQRDMLCFFSIYIMTEKACFLEYRPYRAKGQASRV